MDFLKKNPAVVLGVGITVIFIILSFIRLDFLESLELKFYDVRMKLKSTADVSNDIVLVDIDDHSIENIGRWPWPRLKVAEGIQKISEGRPKVIGLNVIFSEPDQSADMLKQFEAFLNKTGAVQEELIQKMKKVWDYDTMLADAIRTSGRVILPVFLKESESVSDSVKPDQYLTSQSIRNVTNPKGLESYRANMITLPLPIFLEGAAKGIGHVNLNNDLDGKIRKEPLIYKYGSIYIPSYTLKLAAAYQNIPDGQIAVEIGESVAIGSRQIPTTPKSELFVSFKKSKDSFKRYSFFDVVTDKISKDIFRDKIVLITPSAAGIINPISTPIEQRMTLGEFSANTIQTILGSSFIRKPSWDFIAGLVIMLLIGGVISVLLPRLKAIYALIAFIGLLAVLSGGAVFLFVSAGLWIQMVYPLLQLIVGYIGVISLSWLVTETKKEKVEGESAETNRMLGLSFQSQGMLDMAFDKFRKVPVDDAMKDVLYNLALDYERKRQFNKAASVYEYIEEHDPNYKDISQKKKKLLQASETMIFSDGFLSASTAGDTIIAEGTGTRPKLGRYEILKQLGRGAMGVVYLGQDPRINRTTAIKTFRFSADLDAEEVKKLKQKFFREAESAGTLSHPNIVTIYDAGEEEDLAYIAMEFLEGSDLQKYTKKNSLLPIRKVIDIIADVAEGLDYAHNKGIVHRDIKPANVMLLKNGVVKITDFGIARISATSQTQTGIVKGTPHYMSPEQISGEKVDGRSDIFSLGVMLYQMSTGEVPFHGDTPAALMHQIMNVPHPDPRSINPKLVKPLVAIIDKAMEKDRAKRYQKAIQMAEHLRTLGKKIDAHLQQKKQG